MDTDKLLSKDLLSDGILLKGLKELGINEKAHNKLSKLLNIYMRELKMFNASCKEKEKKIKEISQIKEKQ